VNEHLSRIANFELRCKILEEPCRGREYRCPKWPTWRDCQFI